MASRPHNACGSLLLVKRADNGRLVSRWREFGVQRDAYGESKSQNSYEVSWISHS